MTQRAGQRPVEQDAIRSVTARLIRQFPELRPAEIERAVYGEYGQFEDSPVRDFIPALVEQGTRRRLARPGPGRHRA